MDKKSKILIIDDDKFFRSMYKQEFEDNGMIVEVANDGEAGLQKIMSIQPDVIILDLIMPKVGGLEVIKECKSDSKCKDIPILVLSGVASRKEIERVKALGAVGSFSKLLYLPSAMVEYVQQGLKGGFTDSRVPQTVRPTTIEEGEILNDIFKSSAERTRDALTQVFHGDVEIGNLQATMSSSSTLVDYLNQQGVDGPDAMVIYSVLSPPLAAGILQIDSDLVLRLNNLMVSRRSHVNGKLDSGGDIVESLKELYNIVANAFLTEITKRFQSDEVFLFNAPMISTPDLVLKLLTGDNFQLTTENSQFVFRQTYILDKKDEVRLELILIFSAEGLAKLSSEKQNTDLKN
jgi:CheY-like chemotaxis protein